MSAQGPGNGPPSAGMGAQGGGGGQAPPAGQAMSQQNLNQIHIVSSGGNGMGGKGPAAMQALEKKQQQQREADKAKKNNDKYNMSEFTSALPTARGRNGGPNMEKGVDVNVLDIYTQDPVIEYLVKKGYNRTEQMLRQESSNVDKDGRPIPDLTEDGPEKYARGFALVFNWIEAGLDLYKTELRRLLWPIFVYSWIDLVRNNHAHEADNFLKQFESHFEKVHLEQLRLFHTIKLAQQIEENETTHLYTHKKYNLPLNTSAYFALATFLDTNKDKGGKIVLYLITTHLTIEEVDRGLLNAFSFEAVMKQSRNATVEDAEEVEGIPGAFTGVTNRDIDSLMKSLKLGLMPMEAELASDVRSELEKLDASYPPGQGKPSLVDHFDKTIKREESADGPTRLEVPYPPSRARDVITEVQKIRENRDRFKIDGRTGGVGPGISVCMYTFHNTQDSLTCMEFSDDNKMVAVGTSESYIRVWDMAGEPLVSIRKPRADDPPPSSSRRLIGHSAPVYAVSFSPSIARPENATAQTPKTNSRLLVSCSADTTVRLWSLETWTTLVVYKGHEGPVWNVRWGPFGHYFATAGWDKTGRIYAQDHVTPLRLLIGHDSSVNQVAWHPNGAYVFSSSDTVDKTVRMWSFVTGECVRVFVGHLDSPSTLECSPSGKILASADNSGTIILWDLASGTMIKKCKGHKGPVWSLSFCAESTVLSSGGSDGTVRTWDVQLPSDASKPDSDIIGVGGQVNANRIDAGAPPQAGASGAGGSKKKAKDTTITPDQISAFPTKKTPVYKVKFTRMNLALAGGCYTG